MESVCASDTTLFELDAQLTSDMIKPTHKKERELILKKIFIFKQFCDAKVQQFSDINK